jgi:cytochrome c peroxidase
MKRTGFIVVSVLALAVAGALLAANAAKDETCLYEDPLWTEAAQVFEPLPKLPSTEGDEVLEARIELGRELYFDKRLSRKETVSCNSCHSLASFGVDHLPTSPGDDGKHGDRNSPTVLNAALHSAQFWDGRAADVEEQAGMPILNPVEMAIPSEEFLIERLARVPGYAELFCLAFPDEIEPMNYRNVRLALGAFERRLLTPAPFDEYLRGNRAALDDNQHEGLELFMGLGCASCHNGVNVGGASFRKFGLNGDYWVHTKSMAVDKGRIGVTGEEEDLYVFRVSSLRNVAETGPYFHDGSVDSLEQAVRIMVELQIGMEPEPEQTADLVAFLDSLTGKLDPGVVRGLAAMPSTR